MLMIGDRADTDVLMGNRAKIDTCLTLTGVIRSLEELERWVQRGPDYKPTFYIQSFGILD